MYPSANFASNQLSDNRAKPINTPSRVEKKIAKVATRDPAQRLEAVRPEILSRTRLERVLEETRPYPTLSKTQAVERMRGSI